MNRFLYNFGLIGGAITIGLLGSHRNWSFLKIGLIACIWGFLYRPIVAFLKGVWDKKC